MVGHRKSLIGGSHTWLRDDKPFNRFNLSADWDITHRADERWSMCASVGRSIRANASA